MIFITEEDSMGGGYPLYHIERIVQELGTYFEDGSHIVYVSASHQDESGLGILMRDLNAESADQMHYQILADRVRYFKETEEGEKEMDRIAEEIRADERAEVQRILSKKPA